jgi:hypothetical protein
MKGNFGMANGTNTVSNVLTSVPIGEMIRSMALAIAEAQFELDKASLMMAEFMSGRRPLRDPDTGNFLLDQDGKPLMSESLVQFGYTRDPDGNPIPNWVSMMELGFVPTFYQFVDTVIEVKLALRVNQVTTPIDPATGEPMAAPTTGWSAHAARRNGVTVISTPIDAGYAASYNFNLELASVFKTKLACVPPPAVLEERLQQLVRQGELTEPAA